MFASVIAIALLNQHLRVALPPIAASVLAGCGPSSGDHPTDDAWIVGRYLVCYDDDFQNCYGNNLYEVEFYDDGTVLSTHIECGIATGTDARRHGSWKAERDAEVELEPDDGREYIVLTSGGISEATARKTEDCLRVDVEALVRREGLPDMTDTYVLFRGDFVYDSENGQLCQSTKPEYVQSGPPDCADEDT